MYTYLIALFVSFQLTEDESFCTAAGILPANAEGSEKGTQGGTLPTKKSRAGSNRNIYGFWLQAHDTDPQMYRFPGGQPSGTRDRRNCSSSWHARVLCITFPARTVNLHTSAKQEMDWRHACASISATSPHKQRQTIWPSMPPRLATYLRVLEGSICPPNST